MTTQQTVFCEEHDWIYTKTYCFTCKILAISNNAIIYLFKGHKQGMPLHRVQYFKYGGI